MYTYTQQMKTQIISGRRHLPQGLKEFPWTKFQVRYNIKVKTIKHNKTSDHEQRKNAETTVKLGLQRPPLLVLSDTVRKSNRCKEIKKY